MDKFVDVGFRSTYPNFKTPYNIQGLNDFIGNCFTIFSLFNLVHVLREVVDDPASGSRTYRFKNFSSLLYKAHI
jgi:hypothetical protein